MISDEQTSLPSILSPTSDFPCGVNMFITISKEKENVKKKKQRLQQKIGLISRMPVTLFVHVCSLL